MYVTVNIQFNTSHNFFFLPHLSSWWVLRVFCLNLKDKAARSTWEIQLDTEWTRLTNLKLFLIWVTSERLCAAFIKTCHRIEYIWLGRMCLVYPYHSECHYGYIRLHTPVSRCWCNSTSLNNNNKNNNPIKIVLISPSLVRTTVTPCQ